MSNKQYPVPFESAPGSSGGGGATSVGLTVNSTSPSGIFTVTGSPVTTSGSLNFNLAGTSGGVPYFSSGTVLSSSAALASGHVLLGGGAGSAPTSDANLDDGITTANTLTYAGAGGIAATNLALTGSTSGQVTLTAPAVAGTITNAILVSNSLQLASGTVLSINGDSGISRLAADSLAFGNGTAGDFSAALKFGTLNATSGAQSNIGGLAFITSGSGLSGVPSIRTGGTVAVPTFLVLNSGGAQTLFLNFDSGTGGVSFCNGTHSATAGVSSAGVFSSGGTAGVSAGPFTAVTGITTVGGLVTSLSGTSDERLKDSVAYTGGLAEIEAITPVKYTWNTKGQEHTGLSGTRQYVGFLAQDVQKSIPEAITATEPSKDGTETYLSFDDRPVLAALLNAVKELSARVKELESR